MRVVIQRVTEASVTIDGKTAGSIGLGYVVLLGIGENDTSGDVDWLVRKIAGLRVLADDEGHMNRALNEVGGEVLVISQFTLFASYRKGNRPGFTKAAQPVKAIPLYELFLSRLEAETGRSVARGEFGADMQVHLVNDGPVTIVMDSKNPE